MGKKSGSYFRDLTEETIFWVKIKFFDGDPGWKNSDPGWKNSDPG